MSDTLKQILDRKWFYEFELPNGKKTKSYLPDDAQLVHTTRLEMMDSILIHALKASGMRLRLLI